MKKIFICAALLFVVLAVILLVPKKSQTQAEFLRIHIRADSNQTDDQDVKYVVKAAVVEYLTPFVATAQTKQAAMDVVESHLPQIKQVCDSTLVSHGKTYTSSVKLCKERFPDRCYGGVTLPAGVYDALIIELGSGSGNNWWCVVYPPLCFVGGESNGTNSIVYRSKLVEIVNRWKQSH